MEKKIKNPDVYLKILKVWSLTRDGSKESLIRYGQLAQEIVDMQPEYPDGYRILGWYHYNLGNRGISPQENYKKAFKLAQKALSMDEFDGYSHALMSFLYLLKRKYEKAIESGKRSVEIQPNGAVVHMILGGTLSYAGRVDEAIVYLKRAIRLNPFPAWFYYYNLGRCYLQNGQYENAIMEFKKALQRTPDAFHPHAGLAITYILLDREEEARASAAKTLELNPNFTVTAVSKTLKYKNQAYKKLLFDAMRKAGFPE
jgi:tetratricopeptide (TPR) repeat protein